MYTVKVSCNTNVTQISILHLACPKLFGLEMFLVTWHNAHLK